MRFNRISFAQASLVAFTAILLTLIGSAPGLVMFGAAANPDPAKKEPLHLKLILERVYLDGEVSEESVQEKVTSLESFWSKYDQWQLKGSNESSIIFTKKVDDISPLLKANGYFGVTDKGVLSIFNGKPEHSKIIQSFFQIDVKKLESRKQQELTNGIPVKTKDRYVKVLETFKPYSLKRLN